MAASMLLECPYCGAEKIGFSIRHEIEGVKRDSHGKRIFRVTMTCSKCEEAVIARIADTGTGQHGTPGKCPIDPTELGWRLTNFFPSPRAPQCPVHTPEPMKGLFLQAARAMKRGDPDASGAMSRKVIDTSTQSLLAARAKTFGTIAARIDVLASEGKLTPDLKDWAHVVRLDGNDAAHDLDPFTPAEAKELLAFADLYLTYVYSLPGMLNDRKQRAEEEKAEEAERAKQAQT